MRKKVYKVESVGEIYGVEECIKFTLFYLILINLGKG